MTEELTKKQEKVLAFIRQRIREQVPPTIREIAQELGFSSTGTVRDYLSALVKKGYLKRSQNKSRAIVLTQDTFRRIPIIATIAAGPANMAYEEIQGYVDTYDLFLGRINEDDVFALKVKGESMCDAGILDEDIAIIKKQSVAQNGDIIAALLEHNEVTLKRFRRKGSTVYLEPANSSYQPIHSSFTVIGKLISIVRKYR
jgi:repressor LexA